MVLSYSSAKCSSGQFKCDASCLNWVSSKLCSHSLAVAELNNDLVTFLEWYKNSSEHPNITSVAMASLSSGRGRNGGVPKRKRCRKKMDGPEVSIPRPAFQPTVAVTSPNMPVGERRSQYPALSIQHPNNFPSAPFNSSVVGQVNSELNKLETASSPASPPASVNNIPPASVICLLLYLPLQLICLLAPE